MPKLYSYVVDHDLGFAPHPFEGMCTLAKCKVGSEKRDNVVEMAKLGDWIAGTGGADLSKSAGHRKLVYAMRVDDKIPLAEYCRAYKGKRIDAEHEIVEAGRWVLISRHFFYFGRNAIDLSEIPSHSLIHPFEKKGPGYRCDFSDGFIQDFASWLEQSYRVGRHGDPCKPQSKLRIPSCVTEVKRK
jgi:hypothetical protein